MIYSDYSIGEYKKQTYIPKICSKNFLTNICSRCILIPEQRFVLIHFEKEDERYDKENPAKAVYFILFYLLMAIAIMVTVICAFAMTSNAKQDHNMYKYYTSVQVEDGDSLWSIAKEYSDVDSYASYTDYIDEVKQINHISGDDIHAGEYLTIPYYSAQVQ